VIPSLIAAAILMGALSACASEQTATVSPSQSGAPANADPSVGSPGVATSSAAESPTQVPASPMPTPATTSSPATPIPIQPSALLPPGSEARVVVDAVQVRQEPGTTAPVDATLRRDAVVYLAGPPFARQADGFDWRWIIAGEPRGAGWMAIGDGTSAYLATVEVACPEHEADLATVIAMTEWARLSCFGGRELVLDGTVISGFGGYILGTFEPAWLAHPFAFSGAISAGEGYMFYHAAPGTEFGSGSDGQRLRITGHFDDPAAATCRISTGDPEVADPDELAILHCREKFVATSVELIED